MTFATTSFRKNYQVIRSSGTWTNGLFVQSPPINLTISATILPAGMSDFEVLQTLFGGQRVSDLKRVYTNTELQIADPSMDTSSTSGPSADLLIFRGQQFRMVHKAEWLAGNLDHFKYLAARVLEQ